MKNYIDYYYKFNIYDLSYIDGKYIFKNENSMYLLDVCYDSNLLIYYYDLKNQLNKYGNFFQIVLNIDGKLITIIDGKPFVLMKIGFNSNRLITMNDLKINLFVNISEKIALIDHSDWVNLWEQKIDYVEKWFVMKNEKFQQLSPVLNYFIGISENALLYLKIAKVETIKEYSDNLVIQHNRIDNKYRLFDYYNPVKLIIDHPSRDISEYMKSSFKNGVVDYGLLNDFLGKNKFSEYGLRLLYARMLFPSFFFDYIERKVLKNEDFDTKYLEGIIIEHQEFLKQISKLLNEKYGIPVIKWIIKKA